MDTLHSSQKSLKKHLDEAVYHLKGEISQLRHAISEEMDQMSLGLEEQIQSVAGSVNQRLRQALKKPKRNYYVVRAQEDQNRYDYQP